MKHIFKQGAFVATAIAAVILTQQTVFADPFLINSKNFPDKAVREAVTYSAEFALDENEEIMKDSKGNTYYESDSVTSLYCYSKSAVKNLKGIELFPNLTSLSVENYSGKTVDLTANPKIESIHIYGKNFTTLKLANSKSVQIFGTDSPKFNSDLKKLKNVTFLELLSNNISSFNIKDFPNLTFLSMSSNKLTKLDVSHAKKLNALYLYNCKNVKDVKLGALKTLDNLSLEKTPNIKSVDVSKCSNLTSLSITDTKISKIDITKNPKLSLCSLNGNKQLTALDVSKNSKLEYLNVGSTGIQKLNIDNNKKIDTLKVYNTKISSLNLKNTKKLESINYTNSAIKSLPLNQLYKQLSITYSDITPGSSINLSNYIGTGYTLKAGDDNKYITFDSKNSVITTKKNAKDIAIVTLKKGNCSYNILIFFK